MSGRWKLEAECLRFAAVTQNLSQTGKPKHPPVGLQAQGETRPSSVMLRRFSQGKEERADRSLHQTLSATQLLDPIY